MPSKRRWKEYRLARERYGLGTTLIWVNRPILANLPPHFGRLARFGLP